MSAPACLQVPPGVLGSYLDEVGEVMEMAGRPLDPHQRTAVEALTSYTRGGKWPTFVAGVEGPRQTVGKTGGIMLPIALTLCLTFVQDERTWTAHRLDTTSKTFADARKLLGVYGPREEWGGELASRVRGVGLENGNEHIEFMNGSVLWFKARSGRAGRGLSGHDVFADELLYAADDQFEALLPTMATRSAQGSPRLWTASSSALATSTYLRKLRKRAVAGDRGVVYVGWWAAGSWKKPPCQLGIRCTHLAGSVGCALDDPALRRSANPGLGVRTAPEFLDEMRDQLSALGFGREFMGWEESGDESDVTIPLDAWDARADPTSSVADSARPVFALDVAPDRRSGSIGVAGRREDGGRHLGLADYQGGGIGWMVPRLLQLIERHDPTVVVLDGEPAKALLPKLLDAGLRRRSPEDPAALLVVTSASEMGQACGGLFDDVTADESTVWHRGDPIVHAALGAAEKRFIGDGGWAFGRKASAAASAGDISPAVVMALANWGHAMHGAADYDLSGSFG